ncbi:hypothetical protein FRB99_000931 [Tulasnella sp. 403]|nr:hypothetical protein FRB99_000931 [Tulasnella sp. 403]
MAQDPSSTNFLLVPNLGPLPDMNKRPRPSFPLKQNTSMSPENKLHLQLTHSIFKPPQHKHAHHLHSIPPREKTTRTLILDHMLWLHARARFEQVRAELGMSPGRSSALEDEDDDLGNASDVDAAMDWTSNKEKDAVNARAFKARADGLEKVLCAMLDQPPEELPFDADDLLFRDTTFVAPSAPLLPNGVRLRLAIAGLINDVFAEDEFTVSKSSTTTTDVDPTAAAYYHSPPPALAAYTPSLSSLSRISSFSHNQIELPTLPSFHAFAATADTTIRNAPPPVQSILPPQGSIFSAIPRGAGAESPWALGGSLGSRHSTSLAAYTGSLASSSSSPPAVSSATMTTMMPPPPRPRFASPEDSAAGPSRPPQVLRAVGRAKELYNSGVYVSPNYPESNVPRPRRCPHHLTYTCPMSTFCVSSLTSQSPIKTSKSRTRSSIGAGLSSSGPPLRRAPYFGKAKGKDSRMTDLLPRFLRLSALVAIELGREAKADEERAEDVARMEIGGRRKDSFSLSSSVGKTGAVPSSGASNKSYDSDDEAFNIKRAAKIAARPTTLWYNLLIGLLTRATLQGYLAKGWRGTDGVEVLLGVGVGSPPLSQPEAAQNPSKASSSMAVDDEDIEEDDEEDKEFEPDDMPELADVWQILFGFKPGKAASGSASNYKSRPSEPPTPTTAGPNLSSSATSTLSIHSLIHPQPSARPLIEKYFAVPSRAERENNWERPSAPLGRRDSVSSQGGTKRSRRSSWADGKGKKVVIGQAWMEQEES